MLVAEIRVYGLMEMGLHACESVLAAEIGACGLMELGFDACGLVLAAEISACESTELVLVGRQRSVFVSFDFYGACGGDWYLWWRVDWTVRERIRRRRSCLWRGGDVTRERKKKKKKKQRRESERDKVKDKDKKKEISPKKR